MAKNNPIQKSIEQKIEDERYRFPNEEKEKHFFDIQFLLVISIILSMILGIITALKGLS